MTFSFVSTFFWCLQSCHFMFKKVTLILQGIKETFLGNSTLYLQEKIKIMNFFPWSFLPNASSCRSSGTSRAWFCGLAPYPTHYLQLFYHIPPWPSPDSNIFPLCCQCSDIFPCPAINWAEGKHKVVVTSDACAQCHTDTCTLISILVAKHRRQLQNLCYSLPQWS